MLEEWGGEYVGGVRMGRCWRSEEGKMLGEVRMGKCWRGGEDVGGLRRGRCWGSEEGKMLGEVALDLLCLGVYILYAIIAKLYANEGMTVGSSSSRWPIALHYIMSSFWSYTIFIGAWGIVALSVSCGTQEMTVNFTSISKPFACDCSQDNI